jgi:VanZ family protein
MAVIFCLSAQPAPESSALSGSLCDWIGRSFAPGYRIWEAARQAAFAESIMLVVRKCAHFAEYAILGALLSGAIGSHGIRGKRRARAAAVTGILYACLDEAHQLLVAGRAGQLLDVLIDTAGVAAGILASFHMVQVLVWAAFLVYAAAFLSFTLLGRTPVEEAVFEPKPFSALRRTFWLDLPPGEIARLFLKEGPQAIRDNVTLLQTESLKGLFLNVLLFVPMGAMLPGAVPFLAGRVKTDATHRRPAKRGFPWKALLVCALLSFLVECVQYVTGLGAFDADDLLCNLVGAVIGCCLTGIAGTLTHKLLQICKLY